MVKIRRVQPVVEHLGLTVELDCSGVSRRDRNMSTSAVARLPGAWEHISS